MLFSPLELQDSSLCLVPCNRGSPALLSPGSRRKTKDKRTDCVQDKRTGCVQKLLFTVLQLVHTLIIQSSWLIFKTMLSANSHMYWIWIPGEKFHYTSARAAQGTRLTVKPKVLLFSSNCYPWLHSEYPFPWKLKDLHSQFIQNYESILIIKVAWYTHTQRYLGSTDV